MMHGSRSKFLRLNTHRFRGQFEVSLQRVCLLRLEVSVWLPLWCPTYCITVLSKNNMNRAVHVLLYEPASEYTARKFW